MLFHRRKLIAACTKAQSLACILITLVKGSVSVVQANPPQKSIKLMTYNIHGWRDSFHHCNFDRVVQAVNEVGPDILCLNEVLHPFARPTQTDPVVVDYYTRVQHGQGRDKAIHSVLIPPRDELTFLRRLSEATSLRYIQFIGATDNTYFGKGVMFGNAILSARPFMESLSIKLPAEEGDIELGNQQRDFVEPRSFGATKLKIDNSCIGVAFGHLDHKSEELREKQIRGVLQETQTFFNGVPHLICGDFNTFQKSDCSRKAWKAILQLYEARGWPAPPERSLVLDALARAGYKDTFYQSLAYAAMKAHASFPDPTSWCSNPLMRIDHIFVKNSTDEKAESCMPILSANRHFRVDTDASDHYPVVLEAILLE
jgi:endonuclease/exonuclease/phosphatase family metal-dependent hydrolase